MKPLRQRLTRRNSVLWCNLTIASIDVGVYLVAGKSRLLPEMAGKHDGYCDIASSTILIDRALTEDMAEQVLLHEIIHFVCFVAGVPMPAGDAEEEAIVNPLASALYDALKRNGLFLGPQRLLKQGC